MAQKESIHAGILLQVQADIRQLIADEKIAEVEPLSVRVRKLPIGTDLRTDPLGGEVALPGILICPLGRTYQPYSNARNTIGYRVGIALVKADNMDLEDDIGL